MGHPTKIATCCHCGTKAALQLDKGQHILSCSSCGAPLRDLKMLPVDRKPKRPAVSHQAAPQHFAQKAKATAYKKSKPRKAKKRRGWFKNLAEEVFDLVEDVFD